MFCGFDDFPMSLHLKVMVHEVGFGCERVACWTFVLVVIVL